MSDLRVGMKRIGAVAALLVALLGVGACTSGKSKGSVRAIDAREAAGLLRNEFAVLADAQKADLGALPKEKEVVFFGEPTQAQKAATDAAAQGFRAAWLQGSPADWAAAGLNTSK